jgi:AbiV family abortive infection protein
MCPRTPRCCSYAAGAFVRGGERGSASLSSDPLFHPRPRAGLSAAPSSRPDDWALSLASRVTFMSAQKRKYRNSLEHVERGFQACWHNAQDLVLASKKLIDDGLHAPALSLAVLALEEIAKLYAIDGLLFARTDDHKSEAFSKAVRDHSVKLTLLELFPLLIGSLARVDPRYGKEKAYNEALAIALIQMKHDGNAVMVHLDGGGFLALNEWKQRGFYVGSCDKGLMAPREAVEPLLSKTVYQLAWRAVTTLDFVLKGGNLERYIANARSIRKALTEEQHREFERVGEQKFQDIFRRSGTETEVD